MCPHGANRSSPSACLQNTHTITRCSTGCCRHTHTHTHTQNGSHTLQTRKLMLYTQDTRILLLAKLASSTHPALNLRTPPGSLPTRHTGVTQGHMTTGEELYVRSLLTQTALNEICKSTPVALDQYTTEEQSVPVHAFDHIKDTRVLLLLHSNLACREICQSLTYLYRLQSYEVWVMEEHWVCV